MEAINYPDWLGILFLRFAAIYEGLWLWDAKTEAAMLAKQLEWYGALASFTAPVIYKAIDMARLHHEKPPSIKEFYELCRSAFRMLRDSPDSPKQIEDKRRPPPSPLLASYMAKHPPKEDDPFRLIYEKYQGQGKILGEMMIKEIKKQLGAKK